MTELEYVKRENELLKEQIDLYKKLLDTYKKLLEKEKNNNLEDFIETPPWNEPYFPQTPLPHTPPTITWTAHGPIDNQTEYIN